MSMRYKNLVLKRKNVDLWNVTFGLVYLCGYYYLTHPVDYSIPNSSEPRLRSVNIGDRFTFGFPTDNPVFFDRQTGRRFINHHSYDFVIVSSGGEVVLVISGDDVRDQLTVG
jgi:hypothetical protein